jgi:hypothetical protein
MVVTSFYRERKADCYVCTSVYVWYASSLLKMDPTGFCSMSVNVYQTMWHHILEETNLDTSLSEFQVSTCITFSDSEAVHIFNLQLVL